MTLSTPVKIVALAALALVLGLGGLMLMVARGHAATNAPAVPPASRHRVATTAPHVSKPKVVLDAGLPAIVRSALERRATAVVVVYSSQVAADRVVLAAARTGAHAARAAFVAADIAHEGIAAAIVGWSPNVDVPAVFVVRRPGTAALSSVGTTDADTVAQAAASVR